MGDQDATAKARQDLKDRFASADLGAEPDPEEGADKDLEEEISEKSEGEMEETAEASEEATDPDPEVQAAAEEAKLLKDAGMVKLENGEYVPKKTFIAHMQKERKAKRELSEKLKAFEPYEKNKAHYDEWDQKQEVFRGSAKFAARMHQATQANPWLNNILEPILSGKAPDWKAMVNILKPFMAPFWDGVELEEDAGQAPNKELEALKSTVQKIQEAEIAKEKTERAKAWQAQRQQAHLDTEKQIWMRHKKYHDDFNRDLLYDRAAAIQDRFDQEGKGQVVDLAKVADDLFGGFEKRDKARIEARRKAAEKAKLASGEGAGRSPAAPIPAAEKPKTVDGVRDKIRFNMVERFGKEFAA